MSHISVGLNFTSQNLLAPSDPDLLPFESRGQKILAWLVSFRQKDKGISVCEGEGQGEVSAPKYADKTRPS